MQTTVKLTISLPVELARFIDRFAAQVRRPRSHVFAELVEEKRRETLRESLVEGYQSLARENARFANEALPISAEVWEAEDGEA
ncbi:MAG: hypothetical protein WD939_00765 [Dehalococcoidia bacterium]